MKPLHLFGFLFLFYFCVIGQWSLPSPDIISDEQCRIVARRFGRNYIRRSPAEKFGYGWTKAPIRHSKTFADQERDIRDSVGTNIIRAEIRRASLREAAIENPGDPRRLHAWGCAYRLRSKVLAERSDFYYAYDNYWDERAAILWMMACLPDPGVLEFTRTRFLLESAWPKPELLPLGDRLLGVNPQDNSVRRAVVVILGASSRKSELDRAVVEANILLNDDPSKRSNLELLVYVYQSRVWRLGHKEDDAKQGFHWAQRYLELSPRFDLTVQEASEQTMMEYALKEFEDNLRK